MTAVLEPEAPPLDFVWLEITGKCTLGCTHCYANSGPDGTHGSMSTPDWLRVIDEAARARVRTVQFIGGEPTLHSDLPQMMTHALRKGLLVELFSNLVHVPRPVWTILQDSAPRTRVATSYYSDDEDQHNEIVGLRTYLRTRANICEALRRKIPIRVGVIGGIIEGQRANQARQELIGLGVPEDAIGFDSMRGIGRGAVSDPRRACTADELCGRCGDGNIAVLPSGSVSPCVMSRELEMGTVRTHSLSEIAERMPLARARLQALGMPTQTTAAACRPGNDGSPCFPQQD